MLSFKGQQKIQKTTLNQTPHRYRPNIKERLSHGLYSLFLVIFITCAFINVLLNATFRGAEYRSRKRQRFGFTGRIKHQGGILLHCVSVGEVVAASALVKRIQAARPEYPITITTTTATGAEQVKQIFSNTVSHCYLPYDLRIFMKALLQKVRPEKVLITEVELWPNMIDICYQKNLPVYIINARLTDKSARSYSKLSGLFYPMLQKITAVCAQGERDYNNYKAMGMAGEKLFLSNNMKFDQALHKDDIDKVDALKQQLQLDGRPLLLGASTHESEEEVLISSYKTLKSQYSDLLLVLTPRHPQRFTRVESLIKEQSLKLTKLSEEKPLDPDTDVVLVDKMGVLKSLYGLATVAFVGGSIADKGGHNALEAAMFAKPILMGPYTYNNPAICQTLSDAGALKLITDSDSITQQVEVWLTQPEQAKKAGHAGIRVLQENAGAITRTLKIIGINA